MRPRFSDLRDSHAFAPDSGDCVSGPCKGQALQLLTVEEVSGKVYAAS